MLKVGARGDDLGDHSGNHTDGLYGLFGGTFDPIHCGHLAPIQAVFAAAALTEVAYIPTANAPHRQPEASAQARSAMVRIALADEPHFRADNLELARAHASAHAPARASYTFDTLHALRQQHPQRRYVLILGLDALLGFHHWHRWQELQQRVHIIAMARPGWEKPQPLPHWWQSARAQSSDELRQSFAGKILFMEVAPTPVSATSIRARIRGGEDVRHLLPAGVWDYIQTHNLYRG